MLRFGQQQLAVKHQQTHLSPAYSLGQVGQPALAAASTLE